MIFILVLKSSFRLSNLLVLEKLAKFAIKVVNLLKGRLVQFAFELFLVDEWLHALADLGKVQTFLVLDDECFVRPLLPHHLAHVGLLGFDSEVLADVRKAYQVVVL